jgi:hypothetical protein
MAADRRLLGGDGLQLSKEVSAKNGKKLAT